MNYPEIPASMHYTLGEQIRKTTKVFIFYWLIQAGLFATTIGAILAFESVQEILSRLI